MTYKLSNDQSIAIRFLRDTNHITNKNSEVGFRALLLKQITEIQTPQTIRGFNFLIMYYGLTQPAMTLEEIGIAHGNLSRERVRQITNSAFLILKQESQDLFESIQTTFDAKLALKPATQINDLFEDKGWHEMKGEIKGMSAILSDFGYRHIIYQKNTYFYSGTTIKDDAVKFIKASLKSLRVKKTLDRSKTMSKTVTYVPTITKKYLSDFFDSKKVKYNRGYEAILKYVIQEAVDLPTAKTKAWRARNGTADWVQLGMYIQSEVFNKVQTKAQSSNGTFSTMSFIASALIWFANAQASDPQTWDLIVSKQSGNQASLFPL